MFSWASGKLSQLSETATGQFERVAQKVAPPPTDPLGRFVYACQQGDEQAAIGCTHEFQCHDLAHFVVNNVKGHTTLHVAALHSLPNVIRHLLTSSSGGAVQAVDAAGNTPLHAASSSKKEPAALQVVKMLITEYGASVTVKNSQGQTPYDVAPLNNVRQYLLPLQLQAETQAALDNGGVGLPPGIDLGGLKINNSHLPPPPMGGPPMGAGGPPPGGAAMPPTPTPGTPAGMPPPVGGLPPAQPGMAAPAQPSVSTAVQTEIPTQTATPPPAGIPAPPVMGGGAATATVQPSQASALTTNTSSHSAPSSAPDPSGYARAGYSSAAIASKKFRKPDGFHSSSSDKRLQEKYGHASTTGYASAVPPPPRSGNAVTGPNPFAGGMSALGGGGTSRLPASRYVAVDPLTGQQTIPGAPRSFGAPSGYGQPHQPPPHRSSSMPVAFTPPQPAATYSPAQPAATYSPVAPAYPAPQNLAARSTSAPASGNNYHPQITPTAAANVFATPSPPQGAAASPTAASQAASHVTQPPSSGNSPFVSQQPPGSGNSPFVSQQPPSSGNSPFLTQQPPSSGNSPFLTQQPPSSGNSPFLTQQPPSSGNSPFGQAARESSSTSATELFSRPSEESPRPKSAEEVAPAQTARESSSTNATELFSRPAEESAPKAAEGVAPSGMAPAQAVESPATEAPAPVAGESDDMQEIPLSPDARQPNAAAVATDQPSLYAAIGMPPPPIARK